MDTRFSQLVAFPQRMDADRRQPLPERSPGEIAASYRNRARGVLASLRDARRGSEGFTHMAAHAEHIASHERSASDLIRLYRRRANEALAEGRVRGMLAAAVRETAVA